MAANKKAAGKKAAKNKGTGKGAAATAEPVDPRAPVEPQGKNLRQVLAAFEEVLEACTPPAEPQPSDLIAAMLHFEFARGLPCAIGEKAVARIAETYVDRNEFRVTEAYEVEEVLGDLGIPDLFARCCSAVDCIGQVYNDQNGVTLDFLREASVTDRNHFFARVPAMAPESTRFLVNLVSLEEIARSERSTLRVQQRLGLEPKTTEVQAFVDRVRALVGPFGHLPLTAVNGKGGDLCPACILTRLGPPAKKKGR